jgi:hypothetical protein
MALPKKAFPTYELVLPSTGETLKFRPYLTGEQSLILMAMEGDDINEITNTVKQIVSNCILSKPFNVDNLTMIDLEYIMLMLRAKSLSDDVELVYRCKNDVNGKICGNEVKCTVRISNMKVTGERPDTKVHLYDDIGVILNPPTVGLLKNHPISELKTAKGSYKMIIACIKAIYDGTTVYDVKKETPAEMESFLMGLPIDAFTKITQWFENQQKLKHEFEFGCNKCGFVHKIEMEGLHSFFA